MEADEATAYASFSQTRATSTQSAAIEDAVQRILEQRGEEMKEQWVALQTRSVLAELANPTIEEPRQVIAQKRHRRAAGR